MSMFPGAEMSNGRSRGGNVSSGRNFGAAAPVFPRACAEVSGESRRSTHECVRHKRYRGDRLSRFLYGSHQFRESDAAVKNSSADFGLLLVQLPAALYCGS